MKVLKDYVLVEEKKVEEKKSEGGIILSQDNVNYRTPVTAKVLNVGKDVEEIKVGDEVMYMPQIGIPYKKDDKTLRFIKEENFIAVL